METKPHNSTTILVDLLEVDLLEVELLNESRWSFGCQLKKSFFNDRITKIL
jgi:hypothetical protein